MPLDSLQAFIDRQLASGRSQADVNEDVKQLKSILKNDAQQAAETGEPYTDPLLQDPPSTVPPTQIAQQIPAPPVAPDENRFAPFDAILSARDTGENRFAAFDEILKTGHGPQSGITRRAVGDSAIMLARGIMSLPGAALGIFDIGTGGDVGKGAELALKQLGEDADALGIPSWARPSQWADQLYDLYSPEQKAARAGVHEKASQWTQYAKEQGYGPVGQTLYGAGGTIAGIVENPSALQSIVGENYAGMKAIAKATSTFIGPLAKELDEAVKAGKISAEVADAQLSAAAVRAAAVGEGTLTTGQVSQDISKNNPEATMLERMAAVAAGALTGAISYGAGRAFGDVEAAMATRDVGKATGIDGPMLARIGKGLFSEGLLQEFPQSAQEQILTNIASHKDWYEGVGEEAIMGLAAGGVLGGSAAAWHGRSAGSPFADSVPKPAITEPPTKQQEQIKLTEEPLAQPEPTEPRKPTITPLTDIIRERADAMLEVQDISSRIDMLTEQGRVVPNFLYDDLREAQARFADAKNAKSRDPLPQDPLAVQPLDTMKATTVDEAIDIAAKAIDNPTRMKDDVLVTAAALDNYIAGKDYESLQANEDQLALRSAIQGFSPVTAAAFADTRVISPSELPITSQNPMELTMGQYEAISAIARAEGKRVVVYEGKIGSPTPDGFVSKARVPGVVFLAHQTSVDPISVSFHEISHLMEKTPLYNSYVRTILDNISPGAKAAAKARHGAALSDLDLINEIAADIHGDAMRDKGFWTKVFDNMSRELGESKAHATVLDFLGQLQEMIQRAVQAIRGQTFATPDGKRAATQYVKNLEKVHDALARAVADKYIQQGYGTINAPAEVLRTQQLQASEKQFTPVIPAPEGVAAFKGLATAQRGKPEDAMIKVQARMGGGVLNPVVEHVGDLTHRLTENAHYGLAGQPYVREKVDRAISALSHRYGFEKELNENIKNNASAYGRKPSEVRKRVYQALKEYANEHRALPVYNEMQYMAREAAVAVGERRWDDALAMLKQIKTFSDMEPAEFHKKALEVKLGGGKALPYVDVETAGIGALEQATQIDQAKASARQAKAEQKAEALKQNKLVAAQQNKLVAEQEPMLLIGKEKVLQSQALINKMVAMIRTYSTVSGRGSNEQVLKDLQKTMVKNLLWLHDLVPDALRQRAKLWYDGAHKMNEEFGVKYGISQKQASGIMAVLSPQKDWFMNVSLAERTMAIMRDREFEAWTPAMTAWVESYHAAAPLGDESRRKLLKDAYRLNGKILADLNDEDAARFVRIFDETYHERAYRLVTPEGGFIDYVRFGVQEEGDLFGSVVGEKGAVAWGSFDSIRKAVAIYRNGSDKNIAAHLGKASKIQNFYQNMTQPHSTEGFVTIDTHAVAAALLKALSGNSPEVIDNFQRVGMYKIFADAYREAAAQRNMLPREMQSVTWEAVRGLFPWSVKKTLAPKVEQIWKDYRSGKVKQQATRERVFALSGGIRKFMWQDGGEGLSPANGGQSFDTSLSENPAQRKERVIDHARFTIAANDLERNRTDAGGAGREQGALAFSRRTYSRPGAIGTSLTNLPANVTVNGEVITFAGFKTAQDAAATYMKSAGFLYEPETHYHKLDTVRAKRIAEAYERMEHKPNDPEVKAAYRALIDETNAQYQAMLDTGLKVEFIKGDDPYGNPRNAILDVVENNHLWVYSTEDGFGSNAEYDPSAHPMLEKSPFRISGRVALANDIFRAVHDYFGHIKEGVGFRAEGEDNAWYSHVAMFSPLAQKAMTAETRGQNSWVNYGPYGETNRSANPAETHYADQKAGLLPDWAMERDTVQASPRLISLDHYSRVPDLTEIDPKKHGTGQAGAEMRRKANAEPGKYVNRSYYYRSGAKPEPRFRKAHKYSASVDARKLIDLAGSAGDITEIEAQAKLDGYVGYFNSEGADPNAVAIFVTLPVDKTQASPQQDDVTNPEQESLQSEPEKLTITRWEVYDPRTGQILGNFSTRRRASRKVDKLDLEYGAVRYRYREVEIPIKGAKNDEETQASPRPAAAPGSTFPAPATYTVSQPDRQDKFVRVLQDKNIDIARTVQAVKDAGGIVPTDANPVLKEEMYHARAEKGVKYFKNKELRPLVEEMQKQGIETEQLDKYLHARHVIEDEANARLKDLNPGMENNDALAGMSDADAQAVLDSTDLAKMGPVAALVDRMLKRNRELLVEYGLEKPETVAAWEREFKYYVPLRREGFEDEGYPTGTGRSVRGSTVKMRMGSEREVSSIVANIAQARDQIVARGEKQKPVIAMAGLLMLHPNKDIATLAKPAPIEVTNPATGLTETIPGDITTSTGATFQVPRIRGIDPTSGTVRFYPDPRYKGRDNVVNFRVNGIDYSIVFNEDNERAMEIAKAFKNLDTPELNGFLAAVAPYTRYMASINTQYNPIFGIVNFTRDVQFASLALSSTPLAGKQKEMLKATMAAIGGIYADARAERRGEIGTSPTAQLWERFQHVGGPTGYRDIFKTTGDRFDSIQRMLHPKRWSELRSAVDLGHKLGDTGLFEWLSDYNQTMENAVRLGVFKVALDQGLEDIEAASLAKNITVNFNKKGQIGAQMGALYAFFNANVQGSARILETLFDREWNLTSAGKKIVTGGVLLGILQAFALAVAGFDDDDIPEFVKQRALVFPAPWTDKGYGTIPMPLGFNLLPNMGRLAAETLIGYYKNGNGRPLEHAYKFAASVGNSFVPTGGSSSLIQEMSPTITDPLVALEDNKDWTGKPIYREDLDRSRPTPGHSRARDTATVWAKVLSRAINFVTGGNEYRPGLASPTPDAIDYLIGQATGGVGRETSKTAQVIESMATGEDLPVYKIPLVGRFAGSASGKSVVREKFYNDLKEINMSVAEFKGRLKNQDGASQFRLDHPEVALGQMASMTQDLVSKLTKQKHDMVQKGASRDAVRLQEERITATMKRLTDEFSRLTGE